MNRDKPVCIGCGLRIERDADGNWKHLSTVAGREADERHQAVPKR